MSTKATQEISLLSRLSSLSEDELRRELADILTRQKLGLVWESSAIERDQAINANVVLPFAQWEHSCLGPDASSSANLIIEGDNFDSLRLLRATHSGKVRVILIDPPYNTGNQDWQYNDKFVGKNDRWRHSQWLEFLYQRLCLARDLLTPDGVIMVCINDENRSRLELLMDEVFPGRRLGSFVWRTRQGSMDANGRFSADHEHVLIYANQGFSFAGSERDETKYDNPDNDPRGAWGSQMLIQSKSVKDRPEAYYPIRNPETDTWYLCDPDSAWRFSSITRPLNKKKRQADPIETIVSEGRILWPNNEKTVVFGSKAEILESIESGSAPKELQIYSQISSLEKLAPQDVKVARLLTYIEPIESWVGRRLGYGRPRYKRFRDSLKQDSNPLSSWFQTISSSSKNDQDDFEESFTLAVGTTSEGTSLLRKIQNNKDFPYPKPLSLIKGLLSQATRPGDTVLDFFAGSGTTGHAVLALNAEDGGQRRFILCSSTEATSKEPKKNLCLDVCAERMRRVIAGYGNTPGLAGDFVYLTMDKIDPADLDMDAQPDHILQLLALRYSGKAVATPASASPIHLLAVQPGAAVVYVPTVNSAALSALTSLSEERLMVFSDRPQTISEAMQNQEKTCISLSALEELAKGQTTPMETPQDLGMILTQESTQ